MATPIAASAPSQRAIIDRFVGWNTSPDSMRVATYRLHDQNTGERVLAKVQITSRVEGDKLTVHIQISGEMSSESRARIIRKLAGEIIRTADKAGIEARPAITYSVAR